MMQSICWHKLSQFCQRSRIVQISEMDCSCGTGSCLIWYSAQGPSVFGCSATTVCCIDKSATPVAQHGFYLWRGINNRYDIILALARMLVVALRLLLLSPASFSPIPPVKALSASSTLRRLALPLPEAQWFLKVHPLSPPPQ